MKNKRKLTSDLFQYEDLNEASHNNVQLALVDMAGNAITGFVHCKDYFQDLFFSFFHSETFKFYVNGNGGFVGNYLETTFLNNLININSLNLKLIKFDRIKIDFHINSELQNAKFIPFFWSMVRNSS